MRSVMLHGWCANGPTPQPRQARNRRQRYRSRARRTRWSPHRPPVHGPTSTSVGDCSDLVGVATVALALVLRAVAGPVPGLGILILSMVEFAVLTLAVDPKRVVDELD